MIRGIQTPEAYFRELTQLRHTGNPEQCFSDFLCVLVMVLDLSKARRVYTFIEGLLEPLRGLLKSHRSSTLQELVLCARDLHGAIPKTRAPFPAQNPFPQKGHGTRLPSSRTTQGGGS